MLQLFHCRDPVQVQIQDHHNVVGWTTSGLLLQHFVSESIAQYSQPIDAVVGQCDGFDHQVHIIIFLTVRERKFVFLSSLTVEDIDIDVSSSALLLHGLAPGIECGEYADIVEFEYCGEDGDAGSCDGRWWWWW